MNTDKILSAYRSADGEASCYKITPKLKSGESLSTKQAAMVYQLDKLLQSSAALKEELVVYRGCALEDLDTSFSYPSFMSTSADLIEAMRFCRGCIARIAVPPGMKILKVSPEDNEVYTLERQEYLLPRDLTFELEEWILTEEESMKISFSSPSNLVTIRPLKLMPIQAEQ
jgi:hypothetical protein